MPASRVDEYCEEARTLAAEYPDIELLCGTELDWLGSDEDRTFSPDEFERFDLVLGSVHYVDGWAFDDPDKRAHWDEVGADDIWRRYFELWCDAVTSSMPFDVMSHPDLVKKFGYWPSFDTTALYARAAEAAHDAGRMIELNTSGAFYACKEVFPGPGLLAAFHHAEVPCTIGTDAHEVANVARGIDDAYRHLYEAGYREVTVPTHNHGRRTIEIER
jgi:histidinol-phosphatase (PHP family)